jgi:AraC family transcriptional regulator
MPRRNEITGRLGTELYSIEQYPTEFFNSFKPNVPFLKWAAVEISSDALIPDGMSTLDSPEGLYAVFIHRGTASEGPKTYNYIFNEWIPSYGYQVDDRPHFAVMGEKYKNDDPESEEEIWIPVSVIN